MTRDDFISDVGELWKYANKVYKKLTSTENDVFNLDVNSFETSQCENFDEYTKKLKVNGNLGTPLGGAFYIIWYFFESIRVAYDGKYNKEQTEHVIEQTGQTLQMTLKNVQSILPEILKQHYINSQHTWNSMGETTDITVLESWMREQTNYTLSRADSHRLVYRGPRNLEVHSAFFIELDGRPMLVPACTVDSGQTNFEFFDNKEELNCSCNISWMIQ